jgi:hypothetical protein
MSSCQDELFRGSCAHCGEDTRYLFCAVCQSVAERLVLNAHGSINQGASLDDVKATLGQWWNQLPMVNREELEKHVADYSRAKQEYDRLCREEEEKLPKNERQRRLGEFDDGFEGTDEREEKVYPTVLKLNPKTDLYARRAIRRYAKDISPLMPERAHDLLEWMDHIDATDSS